MDWEAAVEWVEQADIGRYRTGASLSCHTSWRIGGAASLMVWPKDEEACSKLHRYARAQAYPIRVMGYGTNLLVSDAGVDALVIHMGDIRDMIWEDKQGNPINDDTVSEVVLAVGAGASLALTAQLAADRGFSGLEFAAGIPGSIGGALAMNAGAFGGQISDVVESVRVMDIDGRIRSMERRDIGYGYRSGGPGMPGNLILGGRLLLKRGDKKDSLSRMETYMERRKTTQPLELPSGGSVFRNPSGGGAGRYIDQAGLKGRQVGGAQISPKHANFIVNLGSATASDVRELMAIARTEVMDRYGVLLESEIVYWE